MLILRQQPGLMQTPNWDAAYAARRKQKRGEKLSPSEAADLAALVLWNKNRASTVYWDSPAEKKAMVKAAKGSGVPRLSEWVATRVRNSLRPPEESPLVDTLRQQLQRTMGDLEYERKRCTEAELARKEWEARYLQALDRIQSLSTQLATKAATLPGGRRS